MDQSNLKHTVVWVHKSSHAFQTPFWSCSSSTRLQLTCLILILSFHRANNKLMAVLLCATYANPTRTVRSFPVLSTIISFWSRCYTNSSWYFFCWGIPPTLHRSVPPLPLGSNTDLICRCCVWKIHTLFVRKIWSNRGPGQTFCCPVILLIQ